MVMWLVTTMVGAIAAMALWMMYPGRRHRFDLLALMLWGASIMILIDHVLGYSGGPFLEMETGGLISNGIVLGVAMMMPVLIIWSALLIIDRIKTRRMAVG